MTSQYCLTTNKEQTHAPTHKKKLGLHAMQRGGIEAETVRTAQYRTGQ